jgi:hypothetical protein
MHQLFVLGRRQFVSQQKRGKKTSTFCFVLELKGMIDINPIILHEHLSTLNCFVYFHIGVVEARSLFKLVQWFHPIQSSVQAIILTGQRAWQNCWVLDVHLHPSRYAYYAPTNVPMSRTRCHFIWCSATDRPRSIKLGTAPSWGSAEKWFSTWTYPAVFWAAQQYRATTAYTAILVLVFWMVFDNLVA